MYDLLMTASALRAARFPRRRRIVGLLALVAALLHGGVWSLAANAIGTAAPGHGLHLVEICNGDGIERVPLPLDAGGPAQDAPVPSEHEACGDCICSAGERGGQRLADWLEVAFEERTRVHAEPLARAPHGIEPYALSPSRGPPRT